MLKLFQGVLFILSGVSTLLSFYYLSKKEANVGISCIFCASYLFIFAKTLDKKNNPSQMRVAFSELRFLFLACSVPFLCILIWFMYRQLPRLASPHFNGTLIGLDKGRKERGREYFYPVVDFTDENGKTYRLHEKSSALFPPFEIGQKIDIVRLSSGYSVITRDEVKETTIGFTIIGGFFSICFGAFLIANSIYRQSLNLSRSIKPSPFV